MSRRMWGTAFALCWAMTVGAGTAGAQTRALPRYDGAAADQYDAPSTGPSDAGGSAPATAAGEQSGAAPSRSTGGAGTAPSASPGAPSGDDAPAAADATTPATSRPDEAADAPADDDGTTTPRGPAGGDAPAAAAGAPSSAAGIPGAAAGERLRTCPADPVLLPRPLAEAVSSREQRSRGCTVHLVQFGERVPGDVRRAIARAEGLAGLDEVFDAPVTEDDLRAFLRSDAAAALGDDPAAVGDGLARALIDGAPGSDRIVRMLFGGADLARMEHVVVTQAPGLDDDERAFAAGFARGLWVLRIPVGYVEAADASASAVSAYARADVPTVDGVESPGGARDLAAILVEDVQADFGTKDAARVPIDAPGRLLAVDRTSAPLAVVEAAGAGGGGATWLALAGLGLAAACWTGLGFRQARRRRSAH